MTETRPFSHVAALLASGLVLATSGCAPGDLLGSDQGHVRFVLSTDGAPMAAPAFEASAPAATAALDGVAREPELSNDHDRPRDDHRRLQSANVTFSSVLARDLDGVLVDVAMDLPVTVDVLTMEGGGEVVLPEGELPPATYDQVVVVMTEVAVVLMDGTGIAITPPGGGWTAIVPICPFSVEDGGTTTVGIQFDVRRAFQWREGRYFFHPRFECEAEPEPDDG